MIDIREIIKKIEFLPPIPVTFYKVLQLLNVPNVQVDLIVEMIQYDPSLSANILKLCQSPYYARGDIDSLKQAVTRIGFNELQKMVLSDYIGEDYRDISRLIREKQLTFHEAESAILGTTHAEVGAMILEKWHFQEPLVTAVRFHHQPDIAPDSYLTHFVSLCSTISLMIGFNTEMDGMAYKGFGELYKKYGIREKDIETIMAGSLEKIREVESLFQ